MSQNMHTSNSLLVAKAIKQLGFESLNPMQTEMLEVSKRGKEIMLFSPTGSGKTVAFLLPLLQNISEFQNNTKALIIVPSRELALQIEMVFKAMATGLKVTTCYGGHKVKTEENNLQETPAILIGTPGRILFHLEKGNIQTEFLEVLILDEFDKSFEFGFEREIAAIFNLIPHPKQLILTSATKAALLPDFVKIEQPAVLDFTTSSKPEGLEIKLMKAEGKDKLGLLIRLLSGLNEGLILVFCNHRDAVERIGMLLSENNIPHDTYHGGYEQSQRERALIKFRNGSNPILVTTDLASRGLDITGVKHIIHYQLAGNETVFIHRNGRTARMDEEGTVWVLLAEEEKLPIYLEGVEVTNCLPEPNPTKRRPYYSTIYLGAGKKEKINKADIVGVLIQKGGLHKDQIGMIYVLDHESYAAIPEEKIDQVIRLLDKEKIKNKKVKIARSN